MSAPGPLLAWKGSWALFKQRPLATLSISAALLTSLFAVCCGLGVFTAPWFMCELLALLLSSARGGSTQRGRAWFAAGLLQLLAFLALFALTLLTLLALGPEALLGGASGGGLVDRGPFRALGLALGSGALAVALLVHCTYAPAILIDRGGTLVSALLESARMVAERGALRTWAISSCAHGLQLAPALIAGVLAITYGTLASTLSWGVGLFPVLALGIALGQGMVVASYFGEQRPVDSASAPLQLVAGRLSWVWFGLLLLVLAGPLSVCAALLKPAPVAEGVLPEGAVLVQTLQVDAEPQEFYLPDSALRVVASARKVRVLASDGGGAGTLPLLDARIASLRVGRARPLRADVGHRELAYAIELRREDGRTLLTWIDDAGVRLDDTLARRFAHRLPGWARLSLLACLLWAALWTSRALVGQARLRVEAPRAPSPDGGRLLDRRTLRDCGWLAPAALLSVALGLWSSLR